VLIHLLVSQTDPQRLPLGSPVGHQ